MAARSGSHFFGRRKGKALRQGQAALIETLLPSLRVDIAQLPTMALAVSGAIDDVWLEIGFGGGEHLVSDALMNSRVRFIGCEPFVNGVAKLLAAITEKISRTFLSMMGTRLRSLVRCRRNPLDASVFFIPILGQNSDRESGVSCPRKVWR